MRFAIVTPVYNAEDFIEATIHSILSQDGLDDKSNIVDYIVMDGGSTDKTVQIAKQALAGRGRIVSAPDHGMYDALAKGFTMASGDVYFYLNAGDVLQPNTLINLRNIFQQSSSSWICGLQLHYSKCGTLISSKLPPRFKKRLILRGSYGRLLPSIQQESTYWTKQLMEYVDLAELAKFKLAGDFFLWHTFAQQSKLDVYQIGLGGFCHHGEHLSSAKAEYLEELKSISGKLTFGIRLESLFEKIIWHLPYKLMSNLKDRPRFYSASKSAWDYSRRDVK